MNTDLRKVGWTCPPQSTPWCQSILLSVFCLKPRTSHLAHSTTNVWDLDISDLNILDLNILDLNFLDLNFLDLNFLDLDFLDLKI